MFYHVMTDIETYSTDTSNALILSGAFVPFNTFDTGPEMGAPICFLPSMAQQVALGRDIDPDTVKFWNYQTPEARAHWHDGNYARPIKDGEAIIGYEKPWRLDLHELGQVSDALRMVMNQDYLLWANGVVFDVANLESLFRQGGVPKPWKYNVARDYRGYIRDTPELRSWTVEQNNVHDPIDGCIYQINNLYRYMPAKFIKTKPAEVFKT